MLGRAPLAMTTARLRVASGRDDPAPIVSYRADLELDVFVPGGQFERAVFRVDTGAGVTQMSVGHARRLGLLVVGRTGELRSTTARGEAREAVIAGAIRVRFPGSARVFLWDCLFFPDRPADSPALLGLKDVFAAVRMTFDRAVTDGAPYGSLVFDEYPPPTGGPGGSP